MVKEILALWMEMELRPRVIQRSGWRKFLEILADLEQNTVDFSENYDGTLKMPEVLPSRLPNLLVNGSSGIAVGWLLFLLIT